MKTSIVIPTFNHWDLTRQLLHDLFSVTTSPTEIVVINNGSSDPVPDDINQLTTVRVHEVKDNIGFVLACNLGVNIAHGDIVHLISNDVRVHKDIVKFVGGLLMGNPRQLVGGKLYHRDTGWNSFDGKIFPYAEGWYLAFTRSLWNDVDGFDPLYVPYDFEDIDLSTTALAKGYELYEMPSGYVEHLGARTILYGSEREAITRQHRELFRNKWLPKK